MWLLIFYSASGNPKPKKLSVKVSFDELYDKFLSERKLGEGRKRHYEQNPKCRSTKWPAVIWPAAFNRYRDIDIDMKRGLVKILEG